MKILKCPQCKKERYIPEPRPVMYVCSNCNVEMKEVEDETIK